MLSQAEYNTQYANDLIKENTPYDYKDYMCVFENAGYEIPPEYFGPLYTMSSDFSLRKKICESQTRDAGAEGGIYIKRSDWIDPTNKQGICGIYDIKGNRLQTEKGDNRQFSAKSLCDMYNTPKPDPTNQNNIIISKVNPPDIINPVTDYDQKQPYSNDKQSIFVRENTIIICLIIIAILYIFYVLKFQVERPYHMFDTAKRLFFDRVLFMILMIGLYIYLFCPNGTCYHELLTPNIRRTTDVESYRILCDNMKNFRARRSIEITNICDTLLNYTDIPLTYCNDALVTIGTNANRDIYNTVHSSMDGCYICHVSEPCIKRDGHHVLKYINNNDGTYSKYCDLCGVNFCNENQCYPGKQAYFTDNCQNNSVMEHDMQVKEYLKDKIIMMCKYCGQTCEMKS